MIDRALGRIGRWFTRGDFRPHDVAVYRIVFSAIMLLSLPKFSWAAEYPSSFYAPPWGPYALLGGIPPVQVLAALEIAQAIALVSLLIGYRTRTASVLTSVTSIVGLGFTYSLGKVDDTSYLLVAPLFLLFANWGGTLSVDAVLARRGSRRRPVTSAAPVTSVAQWPLRLYAVATAAVLLTAALPKISNGWLSAEASATYSSLVGEYYGNGRTGWLSGFFVHLQLPFLWETLDWMTVIVESVLVLLLFSWRTWRIGLALICLFHVGVLVSLTIAFWQNILAYGAFLLWSRIPLRLPWRAPSWIVRLAPALVLGGGVAVWALIGLFGRATPWLGPVIVLMSGAVAVCYLTALALKPLLRLVRVGRKEPVSP